MNPSVKSALLSAIGVAIVVLASVACEDEPEPTNSKVEVTSGRSPNASVSGTVTYRERIALTPGATVEMELRDVSLADAAAPLIARQTISDPGQVPIEFKVEYNKRRHRLAQHLRGERQDRGVRRTGSPSPTTRRTT